MTDYRSLARDLLAYACNGTEPLASPKQGRNTTDPVYLAVLEGRRYKPPSSSCGDLGNWLPFRLGCRQDWLNRDEGTGWAYSGMPGKPAWRNNVTVLAARSVNGLARKPTISSPVGIGDIIIVNTATPMTTHVMVTFEPCVLGIDDTIRTADYGQPGGAIRERPMTVSNGRIKIGARYADIVLPMLDVIEDASVRGLLEDPETADQWARRMRLMPNETPTVPDGFPITSYKFARTLKQGHSGSDVAVLQRIVGVTADGSFGPRTHAAVMDRQRVIGVTVDGVWGPKSAAANQAHR